MKLPSTAGALRWSNLYVIARFGRSTSSVLESPQWCFVPMISAVESMKMRANRNTGKSRCTDIVVMIHCLEITREAGARGEVGNLSRVGIRAERETRWGEGGEGGTYRDM